MLRDSEKMLSESQRIARIGSWSWDLKGPIMWTDQTYCVYGVSRETFAPTVGSLVKLVHPEDRPAMQEWIRACSAGEKPGELEHRCVWPDGTIHWISGRGELIYDEQNKLSYMAGTVHDITERKLMEMALRQSEEHYRLLAEASRDNIVLINRRCEVEYANSFAAHYFGGSPQKLVGKRLSDFFPPEIAARKESNLQKVFESGEPLYVEAPSNFSGKLVWLGSRLVPIKDPSGEVAVILVVSRDITERRQVENKLHASLAEKEVLLREIHHRVKNTLQMTSALLELQSGYVKDEQALAYFKDSQQRIQSMAMVYAQLYQSQSLAQIDFTVYLNTLVDNLRGQYAEQCEQVNIRVAAQACILPVNTAIPCGLVITELVSNAMKHAFPKGRAGELRIGLQAVEFGKVVLEVTDDGVGLPPGLDIYNSPSFGLRLIRLMIEDQLDGKLTIESNRGTRVVCEIGGQK